MFKQMMAFAAVAGLVLALAPAALAGGTTDTFLTQSAMLWDTGGTDPSKTTHFIGGNGLEFDVLAASPTRIERIAVRRGPVMPVALEDSSPE